MFPEEATTLLCSHLPAVKSYGELLEETRIQELRQIITLTVLIQPLLLIACACCLRICAYPTTSSCPPLDHCRCLLDAFMHNQPAEDGSVTRSTGLRSLGSRETSGNKPVRLRILSYDYGHEFFLDRYSRQSYLDSSTDLSHFYLGPFQSRT